jgi:DNA-binding transcriptional MerR regulator
LFQKSLDIMTVNCYIIPMEDKAYTIDELSEVTGFSKRTIRYYIEEGLLDPPAGRGRGGFYYDSHKERLLQIRALQEKGMKLAAVQAFLKKGGDREFPSAREVWVKYPVAPGIEINIRRDLEEKEGKRITEIIRVVQSMLKGEKNE